jgi:hypothetical protein
VILAGSIDPITAIGQWGSTGAVLLVLFAVARIIYKDTKDRADRLESELREVNKALVEKIVPAFDATGKALMDAQTLITEQAAELRVRREQ